MNFDKIEGFIGQGTEANFEKVSARRSVLRNIGLKAAALTLPFAASSLFNKAYAQTTNNVITALNRLLKIERITYNFFQTAIEKEEVVPLSLLPHYMKMMEDDRLHMELIVYLIDSLSGVVDAEPTGYDFTGGGGKAVGPFNEVFKEYRNFTEVAQVLKDFSVRAYGGILPSLMPKNNVIGAMANVYTVEARHASFVRLMRADFEYIKPWVTGNRSGMTNPGGTPFYANEESTVQAGFEIVNINGFEISKDAASEAFDEPMIPAYSMPAFDKFIIV